MSADASTRRVGHAGRFEDEGMVGGQEVFWGADDNVGDEGRAFEWA